MKVNPTTLNQRTHRLHTQRNHSQPVQRLSRSVSLSPWPWLQFNQRPIGELNQPVAATPTAPRSHKLRRGQSQRSRVPPRPGRDGIEAMQYATNGETKMTHNEQNQERIDYHEIEVPTIVPDAQRRADLPHVAPLWADRTEDA